METSLRCSPQEASVEGRPSVYLREVTSPSTAQATAGQRALASKAHNHSGVSSRGATESPLQRQKSIDNAWVIVDACQTKENFTRFCLGQCCPVGSV